MPPDTIPGVPNKNLKLKIVKIRFLKDELHVSRWRALLFALIFAGLGGFFIWHSFASVSVIATVQAEKMVLPSGTSIVQDATASGGAAVKMTQNNSSLTGKVTLPAPATSLTVVAHSSVCNNKQPTMSLSVDNVTLLTKQVTSTTWTSYSATSNLGSGVHALAIHFTHGSTTCSHDNLLVDVVSFYGSAPASTPAPTISFSASPASVNAGGASTLTWNSTNATGCTASGAWSGTKPTSGSATTGALNTTATYTLSCTGGGGSTAASTTVTVNNTAPPPPTGPVNGASKAVCNPNPCTAGTITSYTLSNVSNDNGTTSTRAYQVYRPVNLAATPANLVPAILQFYPSGTCGAGTSARWPSLAISNRFIVVYLQVPCGRDNNWDKKYVNSATTTVPNDEPYVTAVVNDLLKCPASGAGPNNCADKQRIYAAGGSSGGNMVADVMCNPNNSPLFRGYLIDSSSMQLYNGAPDCPSTNKNFFVMMALSNYGPDAGIYYDTIASPHLDVPAFANWAAGHLGCTGSRVKDAIGSPVASTLRYSYFGACAFAVSGSRAVETLGVQNGGHTFGCQDSDAAAPANVSTSCPGLLTTASPPGPGLSNGSTGRPKTNGLYLEQEFWNFVAQGVSAF